MIVDLSIIIVSWNVRALLERCLDSIAERLGTPPGQAGLSYEIIVVDNGSTDGTISLLREAFPGIQLAANTQNVGFSKANNQGMALSQGRQLLLLNPDTEIVGDSLRVMVRFMDTQPDVGALGPMLLYPDGSIQSSRRRFPTYATGFIESTILQQCSPKHRLLRRYYVLDAGDDQTQDVDWLVGACLLVRRDAYEQIGGLDERFFMYSEELDFAYRLRGSGWRVVYLPEARVAHHEGKSSEQVAAHRLILFNTSKVQFYQKLFGRPRAALLRAFLLCTFVYQWLRETAKWLLGHRRELRRQRMSAYWQVLRSGLDPARQRPPALSGGEPCESA